MAGHYALSRGQAAGAGRFRLSNWTTYLRLKSITAPHSSQGYPPRSCFTASISLLLGMTCHGANNDSRTPDSPHSVQRVVHMIQNMHHSGPLGHGSLLTVHGTMSTTPSNQVVAVLGSAVWDRVAASTGRTIKRQLAGAAKEHGRRSRLAPAADMANAVEVGVRHAPTATMLAIAQSTRSGPGTCSRARVGPRPLAPGTGKQHLPSSLHRTADGHRGDAHALAAVSGGLPEGGREAVHEAFAQ